MGASVLLTKQDFTNVSSVSVNNVFTSTYDYYQIVTETVSTSTSNGMRIRMRASGTDETGAANYASQRMSIAGGVGSISAARETTSSGFFSVNGSTYRGLATCWIADPASAITSLYMVRLTHTTDSSNQQLDYYVGVHGVANAYDGFTLITTSGNATGSIWVYGLTKS